jgi:hypothetical protein
MSNLLKLDPNFKANFNGPLLASQLVTKIKNQRPIAHAFLFGSASEGRNTQNSDLDILLVVPDSENVKDYYSIVQQPFFSPVSTDWIILTMAEFVQQRNVGGVAFVAFHHGAEIKP